MVFYEIYLIKQTRHVICKAHRLLLIVTPQYSVVKHTLTKGPIGLLVQLYSISTPSKQQLLVFFTCSDKLINSHFENFLETTKKKSSLSFPLSFSSILTSMSVYILRNFWMPVMLLGCLNVIAKISSNWSDFMMERGCCLQYIKSACSVNQLK